jgi:two-component system, OmpR family, alkaline phosphatase synthesis response regulator PhoP
VPGRPILVVDDDVKILGLLRMYLEREGFRVCTASDGAAALALLEEDEPALVILDVMLPELDGLAVLRAVRSRGDVPVIMLSARNAVRDRVAGLAEGADDYVPKPFSPAELMLRVKRVLARAPRARSADVPLVARDLRLDPARHLVTLAGRPIPVSPAEFRLLEALLAARGRVLTRDQLLDAVHGEGEDGVLDRTIDVHVGRLREKLGDDADAPRYVATVRGVGYRVAVDATAGGTD